MKANQVVLKLNSFDIMDADTKFYGFLGKREYYSFDRIIDEGTVDQFYRYLRAYQNELENNTQKEPESKKFFLRLFDESNVTHPYICWFASSATPHQIKLNLMEINELMAAADEGEKKLINRETILSLYNDVFFEYTPEDDVIHFFYIIKAEQKIIDMPLAKLEESVITRVDDSERQNIEDFVIGLRTGERRQGAYVSVDVMNVDAKDMTSYFESGAIYENGDYIKSCGYLHRGQTGAFHMNKKVELDSLTGVMTKAEITSRAINLIDVHKTNNITIAIVDVDYFKNVNDNYGHLKGDEVLRKVAGIIEEAVGNDGTVGRIGGDEFMVIFYDAYDMENMRENLRSLKNHVNAAFPSGVDGEPSVSLSIGCAAYPKDAKDYENTFLLADFALYRAKEKGRDRYIIYDVDKHGDLETARKNMDKEKLNARGDMSRGDILCKMGERAMLKRQEYPLQELLDDFVVNFEMQRVIVYSGSPYVITYMAGEQCLSKEVAQSTQGYVSRKDYQELFDESGMLLKNKIEWFEDKNPEIYKIMTEQNLKSFIQIKGVDAGGEPIIVSFETLAQSQPWNKDKLYYYRLFTKTVEFYKTLE